MKNAFWAKKDSNAIKITEGKLLKANYLERQPLTNLRRGIFTTHVHSYVLQLRLEWLFGGAVDTASYNMTLLLTTRPTLFCLYIYICGAWIF